MTTKACKRKHTEITSEAQRGFFGLDYARRKQGKKPLMPSMTMKELHEHLHESAGKKLPKRAKKKG